MTGMGVIEGGWEFVWSAYGLSAAVLLGYAASVVLRLRAEHRRVPPSAEDREALS